MLYRESSKLEVVRRQIYDGLRLGPDGHANASVELLLSHTCLSIVAMMVDERTRREDEIDAVIHLTVYLPPTHADPASLL